MGIMKIPLPDSEINLHQNHFDAEIAGNLLRELTEEIPWVQNKIKFYGKENLVPRLESWHGDEGMSYTYSGIRMDATKMIMEIGYDPCSHNITTPPISVLPSCEPNCLVISIG